MRGYRGEHREKKAWNVNTALTQRETGVAKVASTHIQPYNKEAP